MMGWLCPAYLEFDTPLSIFNDSEGESFVCGVFFTYFFFIVHVKKLSRRLSYSPKSNVFLSTSDFMCDCIPIELQSLRIFVGLLIVSLILLKLQSRLRRSVL